MDDGRSGSARFECECVSLENANPNKPTHPLAQAPPRIAAQCLKK